MKRILILAILATTLLSGCAELDFESNSVEKPTLQDTNNHLYKDYSIQKIDGCQYITTGNGHSSASYAHKGDCTNPIHVYNKVGK